MNSLDPTALQIKPQLKRCKKMKKLWLRKMAFIALLSPTSGVVFADTYNLQMTGTILSRSCEVESSSQKQTVDIGQFAVTDFTSTGSASPAKSFEIKLKGCGTAATGTSLSFSGISDAANPALLALTDTGDAGGMASGIGVEILNASQQPLVLNNPTPATYPLEPGDNVLSFYLRYKSTQSVVTAGNATAVMYFDLQYQ
ncbi:fimbrial protein [Rahnella bruchi]